LGSLVRPVAEDCRQVAIWMVPAPGKRTHLQWPDGASATLRRDAETVTIHYRWPVPVRDAERDRAKWQGTIQTIKLAFDVPHFGGVRHFWQCPLCRGGARKLYDAGDGRFACKRCLRLAHRSQRLKTWRRALARAGKLRRYCDGGGAAVDPFPEKPRRMRWCVYQALREEALRLEALPPEAWLSAGANIRLGVRRSTMGATRRHWWPARNGWRA
jgi:hypothetical protein